MSPLNLAAEVHRVRLVSRRRRVLYAAALLLLVVVVGFWGMAFLLTRQVEQRIAEVGEEIASLEARLNSRRDDVRAIVLFTRRLELLQGRLDAHLGWSRVLSELERLTTPPVAFREIRGSAETGTIDAQASVPSLDAAADFIASLQQVPGSNETPFQQVEVKSVARVEGQETEGYTVSLRLGAPRELFRVSQGVPSP